MTSPLRRYRFGLTLPSAMLALLSVSAVLAQSTGPSFAERDEDGSGLIEPHEFRHEHLGPDDLVSPSSETEALEFGDDPGQFDQQEGQDLDQTLFKRFDADNNGGLDREEFREYQNDVTRRLRDF